MKTITLTRTNAILGAACIALAIAGTTVVASNATIDAVNSNANDRARQVVVTADAPGNERPNDRRLGGYAPGSTTTRLIDFRYFEVEYTTTSYTIASRDGTPIGDDAGLRVATDEDGLTLEISADATPGDYLVTLHMAAFIPSEVERDLVYEFTVVEGAAS